MRTSWRDETAENAPTNRLEALADGVFAIVMTLLVLELGVPIVVDADNASITESLAEMWPEFLMGSASWCSECSG